MYGSYDRYSIVDPVRGIVVDAILVVFDQATGRPHATRGLLLTRRAGADFVDPDAARVLRL
jgi:hypothetical protein